MCLVLGLTCFPLPELVPQLYWLFHSLWHVFMAAGVFEVYMQLSGVTGLKQPIWLPRSFAQMT